MWRSHIQNGKGRRAFKILTGTPTGKRSLGRPRCRWEDCIRFDLKEIGINTRDWVDSAQDRDYWRALVNLALNLWVLWFLYRYLEYILTREIVNSSTFENRTVCIYPSSPATLRLRCPRWYSVAS